MQFYSSPTADDANWRLAEKCHPGDCIESRVPALKDKLENALNEGRILMLGVQVVIGFDYRAVFEQRFAELPPGLQQMKLASLGCLIVALTLLMAPIPYHWIAGRGRDFRGLHHYANSMIE